MNIRKLKKDKKVRFKLHEYVKNPVAVWRILEGITQEELAKRMSVSQPYISKLESKNVISDKALKEFYKVVNMPKKTKDVDFKLYKHAKYSPIVNMPKKTNFMNNNFIFASIISLAVTIIFLTLNYKTAHAASIEGNLSKYNNQIRYNYKIQAFNITVQEKLNSRFGMFSVKYVHKADKMRYYVKLQKHSSSMLKLERTFSVGYAITKHCEAFSGLRKDIVGSAILAMGKCSVVYDNVQLSSSYLYTHLQQIMSNKFKIFITQKIFISYEFQNYKTEQEKYNWNLQQLNFGYKFD